MATKKDNPKSAGTNPWDFSQFPALPNLTEVFEQLKLPSVDWEAVSEWQRKDMEALAEANRQAYEGVKALVERRNEILRDTVARWQDTVQNMAGPDAMAKQSEATQEGVQEAINQFRELYEMEAEVHRNTWQSVQNRLQENMTNLQKLLQPK